LQIGYNSQESLAQAETSANSMAVGIDGGEGNDWIHSKAAITLNSTSDAVTKSVSVTASGFNIAGATLGESVADASTSVASAGTGIAGGGGFDTITSTEAISITAKSTGNAKSESTVKSTTFIGAAKGKAVSDSSAQLASFARGIDGGSGGDDITSRATITVQATSDGTANSSATVKENVVFGEASAKTASAAAAGATADAGGIAGGEGDDSIQSYGSIKAKAEAIMNVTVSSVSVANAGWFGDAFAAAISDSSSRTAAVASGIDGGEGNDVILNKEAILSSATSTTRVKQTTVAIAKTGPLFGGDEETVANSSTAVTSETTAKGIAAGAGNDKICNTGLVAVEAGGTVGVTTLTVSSDGPANSDARTLAMAHATGIDGGAGRDKIFNQDMVFVKSAPRIESGARIIGDEVDGTVQIAMEVQATGIQGGENRDRITNKGDILVLVGRPESESTVTGEGIGGTRTFIDISRKGQDPQTLTGKWVRFQGEEAPDFITVVEAFDPETGTFTLRDVIPAGMEPNPRYTLLDYGTKGPDISSVRVSIGGRVSVDASTTASIVAKGIDGGDGDDVMINSGTIQVMSGNAIKAGERVVGRNIQVDLKAESKVNSIGIAGGEGRNEIMNWGTVGVGAEATLDANGWVLDYGGQADIQTEGRTQSISTGIQGGESRDSINNSGRIATRSTSAVESKEERVQVRFYGAAKQILTPAPLSRE